jgi:hypothetical protein
MLSYIRAHKILSAVGGCIVATIIYMAATGTLSYPYIMFMRQIQLVQHCEFGTNEFTTPDFGFRFSAPDGYCFAPHRIFPADGTVHVLPKGLYSVISEYASGSVVQATRATLLFEPIAPGRSPDDVVSTLQRGGFLRDAMVATTTTESGLQVILVRNAIGVDGQKHFDWAFIAHPGGKNWLSVLTSHPEAPAVFDFVVAHTSAL